jgi:uncharacterized caspase-like protein
VSLRAGAADGATLRSPRGNGSSVAFGLGSLLVVNRAGAAKGDPARAGAIEFWDARSGKLTSTLAAPEAYFFTVSPDGARLAAIHLDSVRIYSLPGGEQLAIRKPPQRYGADLSFDSVAWAEDGRTLALGLRDGSVQIWDPGSKPEPARFEWSGYHDSPMTRTGFAKGGALVAANSTQEARTTLRVYASSGDPATAFAKETGSVALSSNLPFHLALSPDRTRALVPQMSVGDRVELFPSPRIVRSLSLRASAARRSRSCWSTSTACRSRPLAGAPGETVVRKLSLTLGAGKNRVQLSAIGQGGQESLRRTFEVTLAIEPRKPDLYLLAVGVSDYVDARYQLTYAAKDARDISAALQAAQGKAFGAVKVMQLLDRDASREKFEAAKSFLRGAAVDDLVIVFVAGHGLLDESLDYWFGTADIDFARPSLRGLRYEALDGLLQGTAARKRLLLIDTCNSGEVDKEATHLVVAAAGEGAVKARGVRGFKAARLDLDPSSDLLKDLFADLRRGSGAVVISSASGTEFALESDQWKNGVFTDAVLQGLSSGAADLDKDGAVRASELRDYVIDSVFRLTEASSARPRGGRTSRMISGSIDS